MVRLEVEQLLLVGHFLQAGEFSLLVVDLVLHELLDRTHVVLDDVLVGVDVSKIVDLFGLKCLLLHRSSCLLLPPMFCEGVQPLRCLMVHFGCGCTNCALFRGFPLIK